MHLKVILQCFANDHFPTVYEYVVQIVKKLSFIKCHTRIRSKVVVESFLSNMRRGKS